MEAQQDMDDKGRPRVTYVVEHLDPELGAWSALEYRCIAFESNAAGARFLLTSIPKSLQMPAELADVTGLEVENRSAEEIFASKKPKICLLDPSAVEELSPLDGDQFEIFLFGGILGTTGTPGEDRRINIFYQLQNTNLASAVPGDDPPRGLSRIPPLLVQPVSTPHPGWEVQQVPYTDVSLRPYLGAAAERLCGKEVRAKANDNRHSSQGDAVGRSSKRLTILAS